MSTYQFVNYLWDDKHAATLDPVGRLIYRSNLLGSDQRITNTGGGNTSAKLTEKDPLTGKPVEVLWVKGSGGDLRTSRRENFSSLYQDRLIALQEAYGAEKTRGPKTPIEDAMVERYLHCTFNLNPRPPSIDTPLHSFVPFKHVDHTHPNAAIAIAASKNSAELTKKIYGDDVIWTPWQRPGFDLGLQLQEVCRKYPKAKGAIMGQHGLINWANDDKECYELSLTPHRKGRALSRRARQGRQDLRRREVSAAGLRRAPQAFHRVAPPGCAARSASTSASSPRGRTTTPRSSSSTAPTPRASPSSAPRAPTISCAPRSSRSTSTGIRKPPTSSCCAKKSRTASSRTARTTSPTTRSANTPDSPKMRDANPTVVLVPGLGLIAWGKDKSESRVTAEFYSCAIQVMRGAEAVDTYIALPQQEAFDIEYWLLEEAKLQRMPAEKELARQVIAVIGAGSGIGREVALRLVKEGAQVVAIDLNNATVEATAKEITDKHGLGIGVAGSGISRCGPAVAVAANITQRESIRAALAEAVLAYGGIDSIAITAGIFVPPDTDGNIPDDKWALTYAINVTGLYLVADEARPLWKEQGLRGSLVLTTSANAVVAKKGSVAYDTSKAAANHLVRELAVELSPLVRVNGVAPATVIQGSAMFPRERVIASLAKYKIPYTADESSDSLTTKLAQFYADRTLTKNPITPGDQAEAIFLLLTNRLSKTTGQVLTVDGGLLEAFLR